MFNSDLKNKFSAINDQLVSTGFKPEAVTAAIEDTDRFILQERTRAALFQCKRCKMHSAKQVPGVGSVSSPLMIIGEGAAVTELDLGVPFTGPAGNALVIMLNALGIYRGNVFMTNVTHCNVMNSDGKWMTPTKEEIYACAINLIAEIRIVQPKVILALGNPALWATSNDFSKKISQERGKIYELSSEFGMKPTQVIATWHPSFMIRQKGPDFERVKQELWCDLNRAYQLACQNSSTFEWNKRPVF